MQDVRQGCKMSRAIGALKWRVTRTRGSSLGQWSRRTIFCKPLGYKANAAKSSFCEKRRAAVIAARRGPYRAQRRSGLPRLLPSPALDLSSLDPQETASKAALQAPLLETSIKSWGDAVQTLPRWRAPTL